MIGRGHLDLTNIKHVVLDEVDRMLDIGFRDDIRKILSKIKSKHQTVFVSATLDEEIRSLAHKFMNEPVQIDVSRDQITVNEVAQFFVTAERKDKDRALEAILKHDKPDAAIRFHQYQARGT